MGARRGLHACQGLGAECQGLGVLAAEEGTLSRVPPMPAMLRAPPAMIQPHLDLKHFLSFPVEAPAPAGVFPAFGTGMALMPPMTPSVIFDPSHALKAQPPACSQNRNPDTAKLSM
ncbi:hypothetical protein Y1Q_0014056 [Alligator mississippiensis]|uniref:Uncharacterized protein n=1 Tax=Alligator mississippiensis TaxID=8496 RepID=A0A151MRC8_ALLMI|nr:hypothetical protein Y1Q_0014056 [Alligator mississippiensis]